MLRRVRGEVPAQLPSRTDTAVPVPLTPAQRDEHDGLILPIARLAASGSRRPLTQPEFLRLTSLLTTQRIIANGFAQLRFAEVWPRLQHREAASDALLASLDMPKLAMLRELIAGLVLDQRGRKVAVFSQWRRTPQLAAWAVREPLRAAGLEQRVGRIHRLGQRNPIQVYTLVGIGSIEERIARLIDQERALFEGLFDGNGDSIRFDEEGGPRRCASARGSRHWDPRLLGGTLRARGRPGSGCVCGRGTGSLLDGNDELAPPEAPA